jgi:MFS family permease
VNRLGKTEAMTATQHTVAQAAPSQSRDRLMVVLYGTVAFLYWMSLYLYLPTLPTYVQSKTDNLALVGVVLAQYGLWQGIIRLPLGIAADWMGWRRPFIIAGLLLSGLGALVMGTATGIDGLIVGRAITGLAAGTWVPLVAVFSGLFPPHEAVKASAVLSLIYSVGCMLATGVTGLLNEWRGYSFAFFLAAGIAVLAMGSLLLTREPRRSRRRPSAASIGKLVSRRDVLLPSILAAVVQYANWATTFGFFPILARELGATDVTQSLMVSMHLGVSTLGNLTTAAISSRFGARRLAYLGFALLSVSLVGAALAPHLSLLFVAQFCVGLSIGITSPVLMGMSIRHVEEANRTTAMGLHQAVYAIGMLGGPGLSGALARGLGIRPMFGVSALLCLMLGWLGTRWLVEDGGAK